MNERLKQLMLEAGYAAPELAGRANKLAELIVRECAKVLEIKGAETGQEPYYYGASLIEEHFGVEK
jgi:hypothetical protein